MEKHVKIYSTPTCPFCIRLKQFLREHNIMFEDVDVSSDPQAGQEMVAKSGQMGVPVLYIDGEIIVGFNGDAIKKVLGL